MNLRPLPRVVAVVAAAATTLLTVAAQTPPRGEPIKPLAPAPKGDPIQPAAAKPAPKPESAALVTTGADGVTAVGFDKLSGFKYEVPEESPGSAPALANPDSQIPETVKAFNGKRVALKGFMLPLKVEQGLVTELLIMRDQSMCCYGSVPKINEWVSVKMTSKGVKPVMDQAITMQGTLKVGAIRENGYLVGIYQMDGEKMDGPLGLQ
ncbi:MAG: DUF3299 domain-containing protein [Verrucomicrobiota bacterium]